MSAIGVKTQGELDKALKKLKPGDYIACIGGTPFDRLIVRGSAHVVAWESAHVEARESAHVVAWGSAHVEAWGSAHVEAWGSAHVVARGSAHVVARGSAHVVARESAHVVAWGSAHVEAWESAHVEARESAHVVARGSAHVEAWESAHVVARGSAHVEAWESAHVVARESAHVVARESAHVEAWGSAHVVAWGSAHVVARGSAHVEAWESAHVEATKFVAVHKQPSHRGKINGGVVIEVPDVSQMSPTEWCDYYGAKVTRGFVTLYKALDEDLSTPQARTRGIFYAIGTKAKAADWNAIKACGNGLHACASPVLARGYNPSATRYVQVKAKLADLVVIDDKVKVPALTVVCEVDIHGEPLVEAAAA